MAYQVLARKWRPQRFEDVIGQRGVTETLRNAIASKRIAQSFVFAGPRGVGKTTTARILARALNCEKGPTTDPCGVCDACVEIAEGRDIDVFEIDAATHTQVDKVREIIIAGLGMAPVRNRYKIFIIDEVHRLSQAAFDALLKSIEEPPPHVVFMMATTEIEKVPATIQSRSQVFELKTIGVKPIADQLRRIASAEQVTIDDAALMLVARAGDGSMRDAQSALDQVIAFAGSTVTADDVTTVLGLVRRDLLIEMADAVAREDTSVIFDLAGRAVESGYDLRLVVRELARLTRDLLVLTVDPSRASDPEIAAEAERQALLDLAKRFSREDLLRAFDALTKAEVDIRASMQPRYHLEMALLRWIHLRKLVPLTDLIDQMQGGAPRPAPQPVARPKTESSSTTTRSDGGRAAVVRAIEAKKASAPPPIAKAAVSAPPPAAVAKPEPVAASPSPPSVLEPAALKEAFLTEIRKSKKFFHGTVVAQAQRIDVEAERVVFVYGPQHRALRQTFEQHRAWLETTASEVAGRKMSVVASESAGPGPAAAPSADAPAVPDRQNVLRQQALADSGVQALLDVFAAEIKDVEEM
jgi:DNA polymerase III subunit gamma/tau